MTQTRKMRHVAAYAFVVARHCVGSLFPADIYTSTHRDFVGWAQPHSCSIEFLAWLTYVAGKGDRTEGTIGYCHHQTVTVSMESSKRTNSWSRTSKMIKTCTPDRNY